MPNRVIKFKRALGGSQYRTFSTGGIGGLTPLAPVGGRTTMMRRAAGARLVGAGRGGREQRGVIGARRAPIASALRFGGNGAVRKPRAVAQDRGGVPYAPPGAWAVPKKPNRFVVTASGRYAVRGPDGSTTDPAQVERAAMNATMMDTLGRYGLDWQTGGNSYEYAFGFLVGTMDKPSEEEWAVFQKLLMRGVAERDMPQTDVERPTGPFAFLADPDAWHKQRWGTYLQNNEVAAGYYASDEQSAAFAAYQLSSGAKSLSPDVAGDFLRWRYDNRDLVGVLDAVGAYGRWRSDSDNSLGAEAMEGIGFGTALVALPYAAQATRQFFAGAGDGKKLDSLYTPLMDAARGSSFESKYQEWAQQVARADARAARAALAAGVPVPPSQGDLKPFDAGFAVYLGISAGASLVAASAGAVKLALGENNFNAAGRGVGGVVDSVLDSAGQVTRSVTMPFFEAINNLPTLDSLIGRAPPVASSSVPLPSSPSPYGFGEVNGVRVVLGPDGRPVTPAPPGMRWVSTSVHNGLPEFSLFPAR